ncbi:EscU/YscU/HrcU family type III secretion system export apparatus switch protein [uncultured Thalassolituus sp.]|mgnify:CR=1 FL=1|uniref:EscU/YscU/HrcU family type III secretion system export apparatus switch protein n=1 Tax=uncultured Thalassolituus sp. TaxID=285273 RepID=UPI00261C67F6|nr:EscU/YscU/HrcU family type III secretion system export apparatus switch protein [uncultured Thalassolituus sp.]
MSIPDHLFEVSEAIALSYDGDQVPKVAASGSDDLAQAIVQLALEHNIPVYENAGLAQWLSQLEVGEEIPEQLYRVIAEILAFVFALEGRTPPSGTDQ